MTRDAEMVRQVFRDACRKAGIDHRNVPEALAELAEREALNAMPATPTAADQSVLLARYVKLMEEYEKAPTDSEQRLAIAQAEAVWAELSKMRSARLLRA